MIVVYVKTRFFVEWKKYLVSLVVKLYPSYSAISTCPEASYLLSVTPFEHPYTAILSTSEIYINIQIIGNSSKDHVV